jgi:hypothetical protein
MSSVPPDPGEEANPSDLTSRPGTGGGEQEGALAARLNQAQLGQPTGGVPLAGPERDRARPPADADLTPARGRGLGVAAWAWLPALVAIGLVIWLLVD